MEILVTAMWCWPCVMGRAWVWWLRMDLMGTCDAFCEIYWHGQHGKTTIKKNSYSPDWDETFAFSFQNTTVGDLTLVVSDFDRLTDPDQVGKVVRRSASAAAASGCSCGDRCSGFWLDALNKSGAMRACDRLFQLKRCKPFSNKSKWPLKRAPSQS